MRPTVLLFDIDGTLLPALGLGRRAMNRAFVELFGRDDALEGVHFGGMTDRPIVRAAFANLGMTPAPDEIDALIDRVLACYLARLDDEVAAAPHPLPVLPGVHETLAAVATWPATGVGLGTGNLRAGAETKLRAANLWDAFAFGGFACDHDVREELVRIGAERGAAHLGVPLADCRVVVIGDTPRDIDAAKAIGADAIALATSFHTVDELAAHGATVACADMTAAAFLPALRGA